MRGSNNRMLLNRVPNPVNKLCSHLATLLLATQLSRHAVIWLGGPNWLRSHRLRSQVTATYFAISIEQKKPSVTRATIVWL